MPCQTAEGRHPHRLASPLADRETRSLLFNRELCSAQLFTAVDVVCAPSGNGLTRLPSLFTSPAAQLSDHPLDTACHLLIAPSASRRVLLICSAT